MNDVYARLVSALNELHDSGVEVTSVTFSRSDVPIDWDYNSSRWVDARSACPYDHAHTRHWCGYEQCRDS